MQQHADPKALKPVRHPVAVLIEAAAFAGLTLGAVALVGLLSAHLGFTKLTRTQIRRRVRRVEKLNRQIAEAESISGYRAPRRSWP